MTVSWLCPAAAAPLIPLHPERVRELARDGYIHGHHSRPKERCGEWHFADAVVEACRLRRAVTRRWPDPQRQVELCGCESPGWSPPPARAGFARRSRP